MQKLVPDAFASVSIKRLRDAEKSAEKRKIFTGKQMGLDTQM